MSFKTSIRDSCRSSLPFALCQVAKHFTRSEGPPSDRPPGSSASDQVKNCKKAVEKSDLEAFPDKSVGDPPRVTSFLKNYEGCSESSGHPPSSFAKRSFHFPPSPMIRDTAKGEFHYFTTLIFFISEKSSVKSLYR